MSLRVDVNTDANVSYAKKLDDLHRSGLPSAVRGTLNTMAFNMKQKTLLDQVKNDFTIRNKTFFKATSKVKKATGFDVESMHSIVGFPDRGNQAIDDLEKQEEGGVIKGRSFIPMSTSRTARSNSRGVARRNRLSQVRNIHNVSSSKARTKKAKFAEAVVKAGVGGYVLNEDTLFRVAKIRQLKGRRVFKLTPLYSYEKGRSVRVKKTGFMRKAAIKAGENVEAIFAKEAERQIKRIQSK